MKRVEVERSALHVWMLALLGIPFVLLGLDVLTQRRFIDVFGSLIYGSEQIPTFEPRDKVFALISVIAGLVLVLWGLRDFRTRHQKQDHRRIRRFSLPRNMPVLTTISASSTPSRVK